MTLIGITLFLTQLLTTSAWAGFTFSPVIAELAPSGPRSSGAFTIRNQTETRTPVMITIVHRDPAPNGDEDLKETPDVDDLFQIYPQQIILGPNDLRTVRIVWIGDPKLKTERAFRMIAEELPFSVDSEAKSDKKVRGEIQLATKYVGSLYVVPVDAVPEIQITAKMADPEFKDHQGKLQFEISNVGTKHVLLNSLKNLKLQGSSGGQASLPDSSISEIKQLNVLAGKMRRVFLPAPSGLPAGPFKVTFELPKEQ